MVLIPVFDEESESAIRFGPFLHPDSVLTQTPRTFRTSPVPGGHRTALAQLGWRARTDEDEELCEEVDEEEEEMDEDA